MSGTPLEPDRPPPLLAQHTLQVLRERLAMDDATAARLAAEGVIEIRTQ
jgi:crotonobetainyl-CoA:carnitine CoA-transferase CaiB-like acyl-CoA transferase